MKKPMILVINDGGKVAEGLRNFILNTPQLFRVITSDTVDLDLDKLKPLKGYSDKEIGYDKGRDTKEYSKIPKSDRKKNRGRRN